MSDFSELSQRALAIRQLYSELEKKLYGQSWTREEIMLGFMGDVGDLSKLVLANEGVRHIEDARVKLEHELTDCLWSILVLADEYDVALEGVFYRTMDDLEDNIRRQKSE